MLIIGQMKIFIWNIGESRIEMSTNIKVIFKCGKD